MSDLFISIDSKNGLVYAGFVPVDTGEQKKDLVKYVRNPKHSNTIELLRAATIPFQDIQDKMRKKEMVYIEAVKHLWVANAYSLENKLFVKKGTVHILTKLDEETFEEISKEYLKS